MHSFIPHKHYSDINATEESTTFEEAKSILDYIKIIFLTDLGEGHMETFDQGERFDFDNDVQIEIDFDIIPFIDFAPNISPDHDSYILQPNYNVDAHFIRRHLISHIDFRGPPVQA